MDDLKITRLQRQRQMEARVFRQGCHRPVNAIMGSWTYGETHHKSMTLKMPYCLLITYSSAIHAHNSRVIWQILSDRPASWPYVLTVPAKACR